MLYSASVPAPERPNSAVLPVPTEPLPPSVEAAPAFPLRAIPSTFVELMPLEPSLARACVSEETVPLRLAGALLDIPISEPLDPPIPVEPTPDVPLPTVAPLPTVPDRPVPDVTPEPDETPDVEGDSVVAEDPVAELPPRPLPEPLAALDPLEMPEEEPVPPAEPALDEPPPDAPPPADWAKAGPARSARERARLVTVRLIVISLPSSTERWMPVFREWNEAEILRPALRLIQTDRGARRSAARREWISAPVGDG